MPSTLDADMNGAAQDLQLLSPTSITEVEELSCTPAEAEMEMEMETIITSTPQRERIIIVTDQAGAVRSSNTTWPAKQNIFSSFSADSRLQCTTINKLLAGMRGGQTECLYNGIITWFQSTPVKLRLQGLEVDSETFLIWTLKKASLIPIDPAASTVHCPVFTAANQRYGLAAAAFVGSLTASMTITHGQFDLLKLMTGRPDCAEGIRLDQVLCASDALEQTLAASMSAPPKLYHHHHYTMSASNLDLVLDAEGKNNLVRLATLTVDLRNAHCPTGLPATMTLYNAYRAHNGDVLWPVKIAFKTEAAPRASARPALPLSSAYPVLSVLESSEASRVYMSAHFGARIVVKQLAKTDNAAGDNEVALYRRMQALSDLHGFVSMPYLAEDDASHYLVFKHDAGVVDLFAFIDARGPLDDAAVMQIFQRVLEAVAGLHRHGIAHGDLKEENVLISAADGAIRLIDFGSSVGAQQRIESAGFAGTFAHAPPEILKGQASTGVALDAWYLGILLYTLAYKQSPYRTPKEALQGLLRLPIPRPPSMVHIMRRLLDPHPQRRLTAQSLFNELTSTSTSNKGLPQ